jgi:hypothetical protein
MVTLTTSATLTTSPRKQNRKRTREEVVDSKTVSTQAYVRMLREYDRICPQPTASSLKMLLDVGTLMHTKGSLDFTVLSKNDLQPINWWLNCAAKFGDDLTLQPVLTQLFELFTAVGGRWNECQQKDADAAWSILLDSVLCRNSFIFDLLLGQPSVDLNVTTRYGWNVFMLAVHAKKTDYVRKLLARYYELNFDQKDDDGKTVVDYALDPTIATLLQDVILLQLPLYKTAARDTLLADPLQLPPVLTHIVLIYLFQTPPIKHM